MTTPSHPITHGGTNYGNQLCQCCSCKVVHECVPEFDFYTLEGDSTGPLYCLPCLLSVGFRKVNISNN